MLRINNALPLFLLAFFFLTSSCQAAPCYGTKMPEQNQLFSGLQTHSVLNRYLEGDNGKMRSLQHFILFSYGLRDWLCIDLKGGIGDIKQQPAGAEGLDYSAYLGGGYGFRARLYDNRNTKLVLGFQHISIHPHKSHKNGVKRKAVLDDWQFSLLASRDFSIVTPYLGVSWSSLDCIIWTNGDRNRVKSDRAKNIGLIAGIDIPLSEQVWLNIEGSAFNSEAFATSLNYSF